MFSVLSDQVLYFQTVFLFHQLEQPMAVTTTYFLRMFSAFSRLFFTFPDDNVLLQFLVFAVFIEGTSGGLWLFSTHLHFRGASCTPQGCFCFTVWPAFSLSVFEQTSSAQYFPPYNQAAFMAAPSLHPLVYNHRWVTRSETTPRLVRLSCLLMREAEETRGHVGPNVVATSERVCWLRHECMVPVWIKVIQTVLLYETHHRKSQILQLGRELMSLRCPMPMLWGLAVKTMAMAGPGPGPGLFLGYSVDVLLNNIPFIFDLFDFVSVEATGTIH